MSNVHPSEGPQRVKKTTNVFVPTTRPTQLRVVTCPHCLNPFTTMLLLSDHLRDDGDAGQRCEALRTKVR